MQRFFSDMVANGYFWATMSATAILAIFVVAPIAGGAFSATDLGSANGVQTYARGGSIIQIKDRGQPEHTWTDTRMGEDGELVTNQVFVMGRFKGAIPTETSDTAERFWHEQYASRN